MSRDSRSESPIILTIGHSTHPLETFLSLLSGHSIERLADVRSIPRSRHNPQFNKEFLAEELMRHHIEYAHLEGLGGLRKPRRDSRNLAWRNESFRGYADYMETDAFEEHLERLIVLARGRLTVVMCAEALPWRCHRSLIADALTARGVHVEHVMADGTIHPHQLTPFARLDGTTVTYPALETNNA